MGARKGALAMLEHCDAGPRAAGSLCSHASLMRWMTARTSCAECEGVKWAVLALAALFLALQVIIHALA